MNLLDALGISELAPEEQEQMLLDLNELIFKGAFVRVIEQMDIPTKAAFDVLMDKDTKEDEIMDFLKTRVPGADQAVADTVKEIKDDILAVTGASQD